MNKRLVCGIMFLIITIIGIVSCFGGVRNVNPGVFIFPGIIAVFLLTGNDHKKS